MDIRILTTEQDIKLYDEWIKKHPQGNLWQSVERKQYIEALGKEVRLYAAVEGDAIKASALVMIDRTSFGLSTWEIARGPIGIRNLDVGIWELFLKKMTDDAKKQKCLSLYLSPIEDTPNSQFLNPKSNRSVHCEATRIINLTQSEEEILKQMKPKGRYNIRVAEKHGVTVEQSLDTNAFYRLISETSARDGFTALKQEKYQAFLSDLEGSFLLLAYSKEHEPIAGLMGVIWGGRGIYYYGASSYAHRASMAPYLLQWHAMQYCKKQGASEYDLLGIAPPDAPANHHWQGITSFKEKFGGEVVLYSPEKEIVLKPIAKKLLALKRKLLK